MGTGEILLLGFLLPVIGLLFIAPIAGIRRAARRERAGKRSMAAVIWAAVTVAWTIAMSIAAVVNSSGGSVICVMTFALNGTWLVAAIRANRAVSRMATHPAAVS